MVFWQKQKLLSTVLYFLMSTGITAAKTFFCGKNYTDVTSGRVTSPNHPFPYPREAECTWRIVATAGNEIDLFIEHLNNRELSSDSPRCFDTLDIYQVLPTGRKSYIAFRLCGNSVSDLKTTEFRVTTNVPGSNTVVIKFESDYSDEMSGFAIRFQMIEKRTTTVRPTTESVATSQQPMLTKVQKPSAVSDEISVTQVLQNKSNWTTNRWPTSSLVLFRVSVQSNGNATSSAMKDNIVAENPKAEKNVNSNIVIIISVLGILLFVVLVLIFMCWRKKKSKRDFESDVVFQNLTTNEVEETDEYGRPKENTYVEIPFLPQDGKTLQQSNLNCRTSSAASLDSVAAAKFQAALQDQSGSTLLLNNQSPSSEQDASFTTAYTMADDNLGIHEVPTTATNNNVNNSKPQAPAANSNKNQNSLHAPSSPPKGVYEAPKSFRPLVTSSLATKSKLNQELNSGSNPPATNLNPQSNRAKEPVFNGTILHSEEGNTGPRTPDSLYVEMKPQ